MPIRRLDRFALRPQWFHQGAMLGFGIALIALTIAVGCGGPEIYKASHLPDHIQAVDPIDAEPREVFKVGPASITEDLIDFGDVLEVTIAAGLASEDIATIPARVNDQGFLTLPEIGPLVVRGLNLAEAEQTIRRASIVRRLYRDPVVTVIRKSSRPHHVTVLGAVRNAGTYPMPSAARDVLSAIRAAGGLTDEAGSEIEVRIPDTRSPSHQETVAAANHWAESENHSATRTIRISLSSRNADVPNLELPDGAVVVVKPRPQSCVEVLGLVRHPQLVKFSAGEDFRLWDAITRADGMAVPTANRAVIFRQTPDQSAPIIIQADLNLARNDQKENLRLAPGDVIHVEETPRSPFWKFLKRFPWTVEGNDS